MYTKQLLTLTINYKARNGHKCTFTCLSNDVYALDIMTSIVRYCQAYNCNYRIDSTPILNQGGINNVYKDSYVR